MSVGCVEQDAWEYLPACSTFLSCTVVNLGTVTLGLHSILSSSQNLHLRIAIGGVTSVKGTESQVYVSGFTPAEIAGSDLIEQRGERRGNGKEQGKEKKFWGGKETLEKWRSC